MALKMTTNILIPFLICAVVTCGGSGRIFEPENLTDDPACTLDDTRNIIECYYLQSENMYMIQQAMNTTISTVSSFGLEIWFSDGPSIPLNTFQGYPQLDKFVVFFGCNFPEIPYQLLSGLESNIDYLYVASNNFTDSEISAPEIFLPFSASLVELAIDYTDTETIDVAAFSQYTNLQILFLDDNNIVSIGLELLGLDTLVELNYDYNKIAAIETGAFRDLKNLQLLYLQDNNLSRLQEGAFDGLETSPLTSVWIGNNPWACDCELQWLKDWLNVRNLTETSGAECAYPVVGNFSVVDFC